VQEMLDSFRKIEVAIKKQNKMQRLHAINKAKVEEYKKMKALSVEKQQVKITSVPASKAQTDRLIK
jgi:hypothetical protein